MASRSRIYIEVDWHHFHTSEPIRIVSELDDARYETRKIEYFREGTMGYASIEHAAGTTQLGSAPIPDLSQINADTEFEARLISVEQFDALWHTLPMELSRK